MKEDNIIHRLKFYADTPIAKNQFFCWQIDFLQLKAKIIYFMFEKNYDIRAAWLETIDKTTGVIKNERIKDETLNACIDAGSDIIYNKEVNYNMQPHEAWPDLNV